MAKTIYLPPDKMYYLALNLLAHDPQHDLHPSGSLSATRIFNSSLRTPTPKEGASPESAAAAVRRGGTKKNKKGGSRGIDELETRMDYGITQMYDLIPKYIQDLCCIPDDSSLDRCVPLNKWDVRLWSTLSNTRGLLEVQDFLILDIKRITSLIEICSSPNYDDVPIKDVGYIYYNEIVLEPKNVAITKRNKGGIPFIELIYPMNITLSVACKKENVEEITMHLLDETGSEIKVFYPFIDSGDSADGGSNNYQAILYGCERTKELMLSEDFLNDDFFNGPFKGRQSEEIMFVQQIVENMDVIVNYYANKDKIPSFSDLFHYPDIISYDDFYNLYINESIMGAFNFLVGRYPALNEEQYQDIYLDEITTYIVKNYVGQRNINEVLEYIIPFINTEPDVASASVDSHRYDFYLTIYEKIQLEQISDEEEEFVDGEDIPEYLGIDTNETDAIIKINIMDNIINTLEEQGTLFIFLSQILPHGVDGTNVDGAIDYLMNEISEETYTLDTLYNDLIKNSVDKSLVDGLFLEFSPIRPKTPIRSNKMDLDEYSGGAKSKKRMKSYFISNLELKNLNRTISNLAGRSRASQIPVFFKTLFYANDNILPFVYLDALNLDKKENVFELNTLFNIQAIEEYIPSFLNITDQVIGLITRNMLTQENALFTYIDDKNRNIDKLIDIFTRVDIDSIGGVLTDFFGKEDLYSVFKSVKELDVNDFDEDSEAGIRSVQQFLNQLSVVIKLFYLGVTNIESFIRIYIKFNSFKSDESNNEISDDDVRRLIDELGLGRILNELQYYIREKLHRAKDICDFIKLLQQKGRSVDAATKSAYGFMVSLIAESSKTQLDIYKEKLLSSSNTVSQRVGEQIQSSQLVKKEIILLNKLLEYNKIVSGSSGSGDIDTKLFNEFMVHLKSPRAGDFQGKSKPIDRYTNEGLSDPEPKSTFFEDLKAIGQQNIVDAISSTRDGYYVRNAVTIEDKNYYTQNQDHFCPISSVIDNQSICKNSDNIPYKEGLDRTPIDIRIETEPIDGLDDNDRIKMRVSVTNDGSNAFLCFYLKIGNTVMINRGMSGGEGVPGDWPTKESERPEFWVSDDFNDLLNPFVIDMTGSVTSPLDATTCLINLVELYNAPYIRTIWNSGDEAPPVIMWTTLHDRLKQNDPISTKLRSLILNTSFIKAMGDFVQELNGVVNVGNVIPDVDNKRTILNPNQMRFMLSNDRPSAIRSMLMCLYGTGDDINPNIITGFITSNRKKVKYFITTRQDNVVVGGGKKIKSKKSRKFKNKSKRNKTKKNNKKSKRNKTRRNKKSKRNKTRRNNKKSKMNKQ